MRCRLACERAINPFCASRGIYTKILPSRHAIAAFTSITGGISCVRATDLRHMLCIKYRHA